MARMARVEYTRGGFVPSTLASSTDKMYNIPDVNSEEIVYRDKNRNKTPIDAIKT